MARVTVEDCLVNVDNRFELVLLASKRARELSQGKDAMVKWGNDKPTVVALREIADGLITPEYYRKKQAEVATDPFAESPQESATDEQPPPQE